MAKRRLVPDDTSETARVLHLIKQVRHNLFHGGKFVGDPDAGPDRDTQLLSASIVLMRELLSLLPDVHTAFQS